ncbi:hypothetical protein IQ251_00815 [Saccharopolyspora sp. HNM0983]|uniref:Voltage-gated potassium channel n=1 Tax=Saccharopolyspora montiporae TaxID=2781240 RepID=A0A929B863_9PSEU|nr:hypothetical protein [Saccharopolyspora sp. HNM0983]MBE9372978.1 hypothetical protein [Saccharopolyspora sp. HNM0983]
MGSTEVGESARTERLEETLRVPVLIAAAVSVPAVFLSPLDGPVGVLGTLINWLSMLVLAGESALLFFRSGNRMRWLREHWWLVTITVLTVPAVLFAIGPVQVLRLVRVVAALQVLQVRRLVRSARIIVRRGNRFGRLRTLLSAVTVLLAFLLVAVVLVDPDSAVRRLFGAALRTWGWGPLLGAAVLAGGALAAVRAARARSRAPAEPAAAQRDPVDPDPRARC